MRSAGPTIAAAFVLCAGLSAQSDGLHIAVVREHAAWCEGIYARTEARARELLRAVDALLATPDENTLGAARRAWTEARRLYGQTEVLRFQGGPIETLEPLLNSWPVDEAYIDYVAGRPGAGIVHDVASFPRLGAAVLQLANERGGEANVSIGWHAVEFLLWGQDLDAAGAGRRPATDFVPGRAACAERRGEYLRTATSLLATHLGELRDAWSADRANYRRRFEADPAAGVRVMLTGAVVLSAFELGGERLTVAYDTKDQEQEHSCFSDTTCLDLEANQLGILAVCKGGDAGGLLALVRAADAKAADELARCLDATLAALRDVPQPFDRAILGEDDTKGRRALRAAIAALEAQSEALLVAGRLLGHELPLKPGAR